jgi:ABC-type sugar transport system ATPase subunit
MRVIEDDMMSVRIESLSKSFGKKTVLQNLSLRVEAGERFVLLGSSGSGKSTLLKAIAGLEKIDSGKIFFGESDVTEIAPEKRRCVYLFQESLLFPFLTVAENIAFGLKMRGALPSRIDEKVRWALEKIGLSGYEQRKPSELSGGEAQRVSLARALVIEPSVLLLDEPLSSLDATRRDAMRQLITALQAELKMTMIFVTHDQMEAAVIADRIGVLIDGKLEQVGTPFEIFNAPRTPAVAAFTESTLVQSFLAATKNQ